MSIILNIYTATENAHVSIAADGIILQLLQNESQKDHAAFVQPAIQSLSKKCSIALKNIDAIAVSAGPGSYTGLRVGMASAKGLCYALNKPLIALSTLEILANSITPTQKSEATLFCPMLDARRMEVFAAVYDKDLKIIIPPHAAVLDETYLIDQLTKNTILFFGSGAQKWETICNNPNAGFTAIAMLPQAMAQLSFMQFNNANFAELAYCEPFYIKKFYTTYFKS